MAELDALIALAYAAQFGGEGAPMCRPTFIEPEAADPNATHVGSHLPLWLCFLVMLFTVACYTMRKSSVNRHFTTSLRNNHAVTTGQVFQEQVRTALMLLLQHNLVLLVLVVTKLKLYPNHSTQ